MNDKTKWSYLAAMVDGEGCISINRAPIRFKSHQYLGMIRVSGTNIVLMKWLVRYFGGNYYAHPKKGHWSVLYTWQVNGAANRKKVLLGVMPYLLLKKEQAKILLEFLQLENKWASEKRGELAAQMRELNSKDWKKSVSPTTNMPGISEEMKIESDLMGDHESAPVVTQTA